MSTTFPTIGAYNQQIQKLGSASFLKLADISLIPAKLSPIKIYLFGSGANAAVFKGTLNGKSYALRCFLTADTVTINRYKLICTYLDNIRSTWKTECEYLDHEIRVNGKLYPVLKMDWVDGLLINQFIAQILQQNDLITALQIKLFEVSMDLEKNHIGHGDIQCGNIIITGSLNNFQIKLIDYDGMFVPGLENKHAIENGRSEFRHPKRNTSLFNHVMDRFSFWVIITALEAIKYDKSLWMEIMQGGYNTLDNFLFTDKDFLEPNRSQLFGRLYSINSKSLNFYLDKLKGFCNNEAAAVSKLELFDSSTTTDSVLHKFIIQETTSNNTSYIDRSNSNDYFKITTPNNPATVLTSTFQKLGTTHVELDKHMYTGKTIIVSNGIDSKRITLYRYMDLINVEF